jgi:hypothetical protein
MTTDPAFRREKMKTYEVTIKAVVRKTYKIEAEDDQKAQQQAHEQFSVLNEPGIDEHYSQEILEVCES